MQISQFSYTAYRFGAKQSDVECRFMLICLSSLTHELDAHDTLNKLPKEEIVYQVYFVTTICFINYPLQDCCRTEVEPL